MFRVNAALGERIGRIIRRVPQPGQKLRLCGAPHISAVELALHVVRQRAALGEQTQAIGNAAQGVTGAGRVLPQVVQVAIKEVESFGLEEIQQMPALAFSALGGDEA